MDESAGDIKVLIASCLDQLSSVMMSHTSRKWHTVCGTANISLSVIAKDIKVVMLPFLPELRVSDTNKLNTVARSGNLELCKWFRSGGCVWKDNTLSHAVMSGNLELCKWLCEEGCPPSDRSLLIALGYDNMDLILWHESVHEYKGMYSELALNASSSGSIEVYEWALTKGCEIEDFDICSALSTGTTILAQRLIDDGVEWEGDELHYLINETNITVGLCEWMYNNNYPFAVTTNETDGLLQEDNREVILWLQKKFIYSRFYITRSVVESVPITTLLWLREIGFVYDEKLLFSAINKHNDELMAWLLSNGYSLDSEERQWLREYEQFK